MGYNKRRWMISLAAGLLAAALSWGYPAEKGEDGSADCSRLRMAWWGTLYPKYCFQEGTGGTENVEFSFWLAKVLNWW